ncbi:cbb3-type cytochrome oxidase subunit 3 [Bacillus fengqiuensis]|nr:cbb3-type cytochrome oxidase subunit 3 [Bacillus fengqiuensis]
MKHWVAVFYLILIFGGSIWNVYLSWEHQLFIELVIFSICTLFSFLLFAASCLYAFYSREVYESK